MKKIEDILSRDSLFHVDSLACMSHAQMVSKYKRIEEVFPWTSFPHPQQFLFKVAFISICHQFNWDFMQSSLARNLLKPRGDLVDQLSKVTSRELKHWLANYPKKERVKERERAKILRDIGRTVGEKFGSADEFYKVVKDARLSSGEFHEIMDIFYVFKEDPLKKKTNILSHELIKEKIVEFTDAELVKPAIDYHIMRVYLRTGRVVPVDDVIFNELRGRPNPRGTFVRKLRESVSKAEELTAFYAGINVADLNYIEWQVGRSICDSKSPKCEKVVKLLPSDIEPLCNGGCPYREVCTAFNHDKRFIEFEEPIFVSRLY